MSISDPSFKQITVEHFRGLLTTLDLEDLLPEYANPCQNAAFTSGGVDSREGTSVIAALGGGTSVLDAEFLLFNGTRYYFFVMQDNNLYYITDSFGARTLLVTTTTTVTRAQLVAYGNLIYIFLGGNAANFGLEPVRVWNPSTGTLDIITIAPEPSILDAASQTLTSTGTAPANNDTVTIGIPSFGLFGAYNFVYTFKTALTGTQGSPGEVLIGGSAAAALTNLKAAINRDPDSEGSTYGLGTVPAYVFVVATTLAATTLVVEARQSGASQNGITTTESGAQLSWGAGTMAGGSKLDATDGDQGDCDAGYHAIRIVFETRTGYRSSPSDARVCLIRQDQGTLPVSSIPVYTGDGSHAAAECTKRYVVMTPAFGDFEDQDDLLDPNTWLNALNGPYYIAAEIADNTTTTVTVDIADAQLIQQTNVDDYFQFTSPAPLFSVGKIYHNRMMACGNSSEGSLAYVSEIGSPQTFRGDVGFVEVDRENGQDLIQIFQIRDVLYFIKTIGLYATNDNGETPDSWPMMIISHEIGTVSMKGVSEKSDEDFVVIQDFRGMYFFNGSPPEKLTQMIQPTWDTINIANLRKGEIHIDSLKRRIYNLVPTGASTTVNEVFVCDYQEGWSKVKWSTWSTAGTAWRSMCVDTGGYRVLLGTNSANVYTIDDDAIDDNGTAIAYQVRQGVIEPQKTGMGLFGGIDFYVQGAGSMTIKIYDLHGTLLETPTALTLADPGTEDLFRRLNIKNERILVEFSHNSATAWSKTHRVTVFCKPSGVRAY